MSPIWEASFSTLFCCTNFSISLACKERSLSIFKRLYLVLVTLLNTYKSSYTPGSSY